MKTAELLLAELVKHVRPPKDCPIKLKEWPAAAALTNRNWIAIRGDMPDAERERFNEKVIHSVEQIRKSIGQRLVNVRIHVA
jgi:hypothetical protein